MNRRLGLALGGGGLRGVAHVGVLSELSAAGLAPDVIAGTSSGSIVAALYALGYPRPNWPGRSPGCGPQPCTTFSARSL